LLRNNGIRDYNCFATMVPWNKLEQQLPKGTVERHGCTKMVCDHIGARLAYDARMFCNNDVDGVA
jgi:hypothetical protein